MKLIILLILFIFVVHAEDIGFPNVNYRAVAQKAALSPDGETFYTYTNNTLTHWSLNPVKVIENIKIEDTDFSQAHTIFVSRNNKIVFANFKKGLALFDLISKKFIARDTTKLYRVNMINNKIVNVNNKRLITQWNADTLQIIKQVQLPELQLDCFECGDFVEAVMHYGNDNTFTIVTESRFALIDNDSLSLLDQKISYNRALQISNNYLYASNSEEVVDIRNLKAVSYTDSSQWVFHSRVATTPPSCNKKICAYQKAFYSIKSNDLQATLHVDQDLEWIVITPAGHFDGSPRSRKYLYIKTPSGESIPINDATYNKYHKQINLNDYK